MSSESRKSVNICVMTCIAFMMSLFACSKSADDMKASEEGETQRLVSMQ